MPGAGSPNEFVASGRSRDARNRGKGGGASLGAARLVAVYEQATCGLDGLSCPVLVADWDGEKDF